MIATVRGKQATSRLPARLLVVLLLVSIPGLAIAAVWAFGPGLVAPVEDFRQGPGGAIAYISLLNQIRDQGGRFWAGQDVSLELTEPEFSGMLSSALLSGQTAADPVRKVRAGVLNDNIWVDTVLMFKGDRVPERYRGPIGLRLELHPQIRENGAVRFVISRATVGRLTLPQGVLHALVRLMPVPMPGFEREIPALSLPVSDIISSRVGRRVTITRVSASSGKFSLSLALAVR